MASRVNTYIQGQSIRFLLKATSLGVYFSPTVVTLTLIAPTGAQQQITNPVQDFTGQYHYDLLTSGSTVTGGWNYFWTSSGSPVAENGVSPTGYFNVAAAL